MKKFLSTLAFVLVTTVVLGKKFDFQLVNKTETELQVFYQIIQTVEKENPIYVFNINSGAEKTILLKVKKGQKVKIIGYGGGTETLPIVKPYEQMNGDLIRMELVLPVIEQINTVEVNDALSKLKNDNYLKVLLDTARFSKDELPILGTFIFYNRRDNTILQLTPTYWKNTKEIRSINNQHYRTIDYISQANTAGLQISGIPFLQRLAASLSSSSLIEMVYEVNNARIEQWQPTQDNVFDIIQNNKNRSFIDACVSEMNNRGLGGGEYNLFFISSAVVVDNIVVSVKKYRKVYIDTNVDFNVTEGNEIVKPIGVETNYGYYRDKLYATVDSSASLYLKFLAQDYTPVLNAFINQSTKNAQRATAIDNLSSLKRKIVSNYKILQSIDNTLISTEQIEGVLSILNVTVDLSLKPEEYDSLGKNVTPKDILNFNKRAIQFNSILKDSKESIAQYKSTLESIEILNQPTEYYKVLNSITPTELNSDSKVIKAYVNGMNVNR